MPPLRLLLKIAPAALATAMPVANATQQPLRLLEIFVVRVVEHDGTPAFQRGLLHAEGSFAPFDPTPFDPGVVVPPEVIGHDLIHGATYFSYDVLGLEALDNFDFDLTPIAVGAATYFTTTPSPAPRLDTGVAVNLSTRGVVTPGGEPMIGGFIIEDHPRRVLIRAAGPALGKLGVESRSPTLLSAHFREGESEPFATNDNWDQEAADAAAIELAALSVAAFPFERGSTDSACLLLLSPGIYNAHLSTMGVEGGTTLLEIYTLP